MSRRVLLSSSVTMLIATPLRPKRPPRPILEQARIKENRKIRSFSVGRIGQEGVGLGWLTRPDFHLPVDIVFPIGGEVIVDD